MKERFRVLQGPDERLEPVGLRSIVSCLVTGPTVPPLALANAIGSDEVASRPASRHDPITWHVVSTGSVGIGTPIRFRTSAPYAVSGPPTGVSGWCGASDSCPQPQPQPQLAARRGGPRRPRG